MKFQIGDRVKSLNYPLIEGIVERVDGHLLWVKGLDYKGCVALIASDKDFLLVSKNNSPEKIKNLSVK